MPELPDIEVYLDCLERHVGGAELRKVALQSPFFVRSIDPPIGEAEGRRVVGVRRLGKRVVLGLEDDLFLVFHLMIAGRFRWGKPGARPARKIGLAAFDFPDGTLQVTEASAKKRAALHLVRGEAELAAHDPGGLDVMRCDETTFAAALRSENHTLKRSLTDPRLLSGIGNAYSDEILFAARLSPIQQTQKLDDEQMARLFTAVQSTLQHWREELRREFARKFPGPGDITAFRPGFAVHGKYKEPCPVCTRPVQRIRYAQNETNYCAECQNGGKLLADRALSRVLKKDWPRSLDDYESHVETRRERAETSVKR